MIQRSKYFQDSRTTNFLSVCGSTYNCRATLWRQVAVAERHLRWLATRWKERQDPSNGISHMAGRPACMLRAGSPLHELDPDCQRCIIRLLAARDACSLAMSCTRLRTLIQEVDLPMMLFILYMFDSREMGKGQALKDPQLLASQVVGRGCTSQGVLVQLPSMPPCTPAEVLALICLCQTGSRACSCCWIVQARLTITMLQLNCQQPMFI